MAPVRSSSASSWRRRQPAASTVHRRDRRRRASASRTPAARSARSTCPRRWAPGARSSTPTATAGRTCCSSTRRTGPAAAGSRRCRRSTATTGDGTFTDITRAAGLDVELYGIGAAAADFDNDGRDDVYLTALGGNRLFRKLGGGKFADVTAQAGVGDCGFSTSALWFDYDKRRHGSISSSPLRRLVDREGSVLHARREEQVVLHAGILQGPEPDAVSQPRRRHVRGRDAPRRAVRPDVQGARRRHARLRRRRLAGPVRRQRHAAEPAVSQQRRRHVRRRRRRRPASPSARRASRAPAWASTRPTTTARDGPASSSATSRTR